jgi:hypothetical protein
MLWIPTASRRIARAGTSLAGALGLVAATATAALHAQAVVIDAGTFSLEVSGQRVGREDFSIRRAPTGALATYVAQGNVVRGGLRYTVVLTTDSAGLPQTFRLQTLSAGKELESVTGEWRRGLWSGRSESAVGESAREFRLPEAAVALADEVVHQLWFVLRGGADRPVQVLLPKRLEMRTAWLESVGTERLAIGLREFDAQHWIIRDSRGGQVLQEAWTDAAGRLLRVRIPSESLEALRDDAPPETVVRP